jgi:UDP-N-acetylmuramoyl-tripeptide--D-alanyl-D-alanine ligase
MLELGADAAQLHREAGREIAQLGIDVLWGVRGLAKELLVGAQEAGLKETRFFESSEEAGAEIVSHLTEGDLVLIKGSRGVATDKVVKAIRKAFAEKQMSDGRCLKAGVRSGVRSEMPTAHCLLSSDS